MTYPNHYFRPDGCQYAAVPMDRANLPDELLPIWRRLVYYVLGKPRTNVSNKRLARALDVSVSTVKRWLRALEKIGAIARVKGEGGVRTIWLLLGVKSSNRNFKSSKPSGAKILGAGGVTSGPPPGSSMAPSPSFEGVTAKDQHAGGESDGTDPPAAGEDTGAEAPDPAKDAEALAAMLAQVAAATRPEPAQEASAARRPIVRPSDELRARQAEWRTTLERLAAAGDPIAQAELARMPALPETPSPAVESPEVDSPPGGSV